jgi:hypothetical protein
MANKLLIAFSCAFVVLSNLACTNNAAESNTKVLFRVYKIDSIGNYYVIHADISYTKFQIVSKKVFCTIGDPIKVGKDYDFHLFSIFNDSGIEIPLESVRSIKIDSITTFNLNDSISDIYSAKNVDGLCFSKTDLVH